ncbi:kinase-like protein [Gigaspora margarita]|uniref:Kinase-like protein n=1 Tax=Gigaspora margarita TaxID=4874 RepID=A0A8H3XB59_GIGMA|nr:kinase-like protein [Gigaspora margarita]
MQTDKENIEIDESNNITQDSNKTLFEFSRQIEAYLNGVGINKYEKSQSSDYKIIGRGGSAIVYKATLQGQVFALKNLNNNLSMSDESFKKIRRESDYIILLKLLYGIHHPNIIKFNGILEDPQMGITLVLQHAEDGNLRDYLQKKHVDGLYKILWAELIKIATEITIGLTYLHSKDIIHRDLHSKNILINDGKALIADFGNQKI